MRLRGVKVSLRPGDLPNSRYCEISSFIAPTTIKLGNGFKHLFLACQWPFPLPISPSSFARFSIQGPRYEAWEGDRGAMPKMIRVGILDSIVSLASFLGDSKL